MPGTQKEHSSGAVKAGDVTRHPFCSAALKTGQTDGGTPASHFPKQQTQCAGVRMRSYHLFAEVIGIRPSVLIFERDSELRMENDVAL